MHSNSSPFFTASSISTLFSTIIFLVLVWSSSNQAILFPLSLTNSSDDNIVPIKFDKKLDIARNKSQYIAHDISRWNRFIFHLAFNDESCWTWIVSTYRNSFYIRVYTHTHTHHTTHVKRHYFSVIFYYEYEAWNQLNNVKSILVLFYLPRVIYALDWIYN